MKYLVHLSTINLPPLFSYVAWRRKLAVFAVNSFLVFYCYTVMHFSGVYKHEYLLFIHTDMYIYKYIYLYIKSVHVG